MTIQLKRHDRPAALEALRQGEYEAIATSSQGPLDELVHLAIELGVFEALEVIDIQRQRAGIPDALLLRLLAILPFVEAIGLSAAAGHLLRDAATLLQIGFTIQQLQEGFNQRHHGAQSKQASSKPCHPEVLRQELVRIEPESLACFRRMLIRQLFERRLVKGQVYAIDGTGLSDRYLLVGILNVHRDRALWLNWRLLEGDASEKGKAARIVRQMVDEILADGSATTMQWLLMDALYADGPLLAWLEYQRGVHALVRIPEDRVLYQDMQGLVSGDLVDWEHHTDVRYVSGHKQVRRVSVAVDSDLTGWQSFMKSAQRYGAHAPTLWGALIHSEAAEDCGEEKEWMIASTRALPSGWAGYSQWRRRWCIENSGFRELKEGWHLERAPWSYTDGRVVAARVTFTLVAFNVAQIAKTAQGRQLTDRGIRRLRRELAPQYGLAPVIVFTEDAFGIFHIEEIMEALGVPPGASLRHY